MGGGTPNVNFDTPTASLTLRLEVATLEYTCSLLARILLSVSLGQEGHFENGMSGIDKSTAALLFGAALKETSLLTVDAHAALLG